MRKSEDDVLTTYLRVSPSRRPVSDDKDWLQILDKRRRVLVDRLHLLPAVFENRKLLDLGCGTGEHTAFYAALGSSITGVDFNSVSLKRLKEVFSMKGLGDKIDELIEIAVSDWRPKQNFYDICTSDGVLHHLDDPREGFGKLCSALKPGGLLVIAVRTDVGSYQRDIMKQTILAFSNGLEEAIDLANQLFPEYMDRAVNLGGRTAEQVVNDNFLAEQNVCIPVSSIMDWFREENLKLFRSWPVLEPSFADSASSSIVDWTDPAYRDYIVKRSKTWEYATDTTETLVQSGKTE